MRISVSAGGGGGIHLLRTYNRFGRTMSVQAHETALMHEGINGVVGFILVCSISGMTAAMTEQSKDVCPNKSHVLSISPCGCTLPVHLVVLLFLTDFDLSPVVASNGE